MPSDEEMEDGYNSDNQRGPFIQDGVVDEAFYNMDEVAPEAPIEAEPVVGDDGGETVLEAEEVEPVLDAATINGMKVAEIREELKKLGMKVTGKKIELQDCLLEGVLAGVQILANRLVEESNNAAGSDFHPGLYWKLLENGAAIDESNMTIGSVCFRESTMTVDEHELNSNDRPKKRNYLEIFDRAPFICSALLPVQKPNGILKRKNGEYVYEKQMTTVTVPDLAYLTELGIDFESHLADCFNIFYPRIEVNIHIPRQLH